MHARAPRSLCKGLSTSWVIAPTPCALLADAATTKTASIGRNMLLDMARRMDKNVHYCNDVGWHIFSASSVAHRELNISKMQLQNRKYYMDQIECPFTVPSDASCAEEGVRCRPLHSLQQVGPGMIFSSRGSAPRPVSRPTAVLQIQSLLAIVR